MKYRVTAFILVLFILCLSGCGTKEPQSADISASTTAATTDPAPVSSEATDEGHGTDAPGDFFAERDLYAVRILSEAAASAVWQYGKELGWVDEYGLADSVVTSKQLALSQSAYRQALIHWCWEDPVGNLTDDEKEAVYAQALFPGVLAEELPETDEFSYWAWGVDVLTRVDAAQALFSTASVDGNAGYVIVRLLYENDNGEFEDFYQVEWTAREDSVANPFQYQITGVRPMERFLLGGRPYEEFSEKYLGAAPTEDLEKLGVTHSIGYLDKWGAWGAGNTMVLKTISSQGAEELITYILLDDDGERVVYLRALDEAASARSVQTQILTALRARSVLSENSIDAGLFYPGELDKWDDDALCYGFMYEYADGYRYVWVNSITGELEFADEVEDYTGTGEDY